MDYHLYFFFFLSIMGSSLHLINYAADFEIHEDPVVKVEEDRCDEGSHWHHNYHSSKRFTGFEWIFPIVMVPLIVEHGIEKI